MIEQIMYFGIGFLVTALLGLVVIPLVHRRAARLTIRRLQATMPASMVQIQAEKDKLRAEFAQSTRRLEMGVEALKTKNIGQTTELDKKVHTITQLKAALGEKTSMIFALEAHDKALRDQLRVAEEEIAVKTNAMYKAERAHFDKAADLAMLIREFEKCSKLADSQKLEIIAMKAQIEATKVRDEILLYVMGKHAAQQGNGHDGEYPSISVDGSPEKLDSSPLIHAGN
jgi:hypothetical protein